MFRLIYMIRSIASLLLSLVEIMLVLRALVSWFPQVQGSKFGQFLYQFTEPIIAPVRNLLNRLFPSLRMFPLDISFMVAFFLIIFVQRILFL